MTRLHEKAYPWLGILALTAILGSCASAARTGRILEGLPVERTVHKPTVPTAIFGYVRSDSTRLPLGGAGVFVREAQGASLTDWFGRYELRLPAPGEYTVVVQRIGSETDSFRVVLDQDAVRVDFSLRPRCTADCILTPTGWAACC